MAQVPRLRPGLGNFPVRGPGRRSFFTLSSGAGGHLAPRAQMRSSPPSPSPEPPAPHLPTACRGGQGGRDAGSALRSPAAPKNALSVLETARRVGSRPSWFPNVALTIHGQPHRVCSAHSGEYRVLPSCPQPPIPSPCNVQVRAPVPFNKAQYPALEPRHPLPYNLSL